MAGLLYVDSENLRALSRWNFGALLVVAAALGAVAGWVPTPLVTLVLFVGGLWLIYDGFTRWQQLRLVEDTTTEPVRSVAAGRTEVYGTSEPIDEPTGRPFSEGDCVLAYWEVEEYDDNWETLASGLRYTPFVIDDGTGAIRVDPPADATTRISDRYRNEIRVGATRFSSEPEEVVEFLESIDDVDVPETGLIFRPQRRYSETVLPPSEEVYVLGGAAIREDAEGSNPERLVLSRHEATGEFIVSDRPQEEFVDFDRTLARNEVGMGVTLILVFLAVDAARRGGESTGIGLGLVLLVGVAIFLYGQRYWGW